MKTSQAEDSMDSGIGGNASNATLGKDISELAFKKGLVFLAVLGLVVRIGFFMEHVHSPSFGVPTLDQIYYDTVARMLLAGEDLRELHGFRPLLYPMFLAVWYKLGGAWGVDLALLVQHLLGIATGILVALMGARLFRHWFSGLIGGVLFLLAPIPLYFEGELLIEPSYLFLICVGLLLHLRAVEAHAWKGVMLWLLCGAVTVLAAQARANILIFLGMYPLFAAWHWWHKRSRSAALPLLGLVGALGMAIPWGFINMKQSDHFHLIPNAGGAALYLGNKRTADGMVPEQERRITYGDRYNDSVEIWAREEYDAAMRAQGRHPETDPMAISQYWTQRTLEEIRAAPATWLRLMAKKSWLTLWNAEIPNNKAFAFLQDEFIWLRLLPVRWVVLLMLLPAGIWAAAKWKNRDGLFILAAYVCLYSAGNIAFFICDRYRYPVWPVMAVFAGGGAMVVIEAIRRGRHGRVAAVVGSMVLMAALSLPNWFGAELPSFARDFVFRSIAWYEKGRFDEALDDINRGLELDPHDATALQHQGNVLFALNRLPEARQAYEQALKLIPTDASLWNNLGATLEAMGATNEALAAFRRASECTPPSRNAFLGLTLLQIRSGLLDDAARSFDRLQQLAPNNDPTILTVRSVLARKRGNPEQADVLEAQARSLDPGTVTWVLERLAKPVGEK